MVWPVRRRRRTRSFKPSTSGPDTADFGDNIDWRRPVRPGRHVEVILSVERPTRADAAIRAATRSHPQRFYAMEGTARSAR